MRENDLTTYNFLTIDIEGSELTALQGALRTVVPAQLESAHVLQPRRTAALTKGLARCLGASRSAPRPPQLAGMQCRRSWRVLSVLRGTLLRIRCVCHQRRTVAEQCVLQPALSAPHGTAVPPQLLGYCRQYGVREYSAGGTAYLRSCDVADLEISFERRYPTVVVPSPPRYYAVPRFRGSLKYVCERQCARSAHSVAHLHL